MKIKKVNTNDSVIDILKRALDDLVSSGKIDKCDEDGLFHLGGAITRWKLLKGSWPKDFAFISKYIHVIADDVSDKLYSAEAENIETFKLDDSVWEFIAFSDGYEGYRLTFTNQDGKLKLIKYEFADEDDCDQYGMESYKLNNLLKN